MEILVIVLISVFFIIQSGAFIIFFLWFRKNNAPPTPRQSVNLDALIKTKEEPGTTRLTYELKDNPLVVINVHNADGAGTTIAAPPRVGYAPPPPGPVAEAPPAAPQPVAQAPAPASPQPQAAPPHPEAPRVVTPEPEPPAPPEPTTKKCKNCGADNSPFREKCFRCNTPLPQA